MLTGPSLGAAIEAARKKKKVSKTALAAHFGVKPPSIQDWVKRGTIDKEKLPRLWAYFSDVVGPDHWGLKSFPSAGGSSAAIDEVEWRSISPRARALVEDAVHKASQGQIDDAQVKVLHDLLEQLSRKKT